MADTVNKLNSRKFSVWFTWLIILAVIAVCTIIGFFVTKENANPFASTLNKAIDYFFYVSILYLGVNLGQKGITALKDIKTINSEKVSESTKTTQKDFNEQ